MGACSTDDFVDWRFEGIMLHFSNVSDMVLGRAPEGGMGVQQPKASINEVVRFDYRANVETTNQTTVLGQQ